MQLPEELEMYFEKMKLYSNSYWQKKKDST